MPCTSTRLLLASRSSWIKCLKGTTCGGAFILFTANARSLRVLLVFIKAPTQGCWPCVCVWWALTSHRCPVLISYSFFYSRQTIWENLRYETLETLSLFPHWGVTWITNARMVYLSEFCSLLQFTHRVVGKQSLKNTHTLAWNWERICSYHSLHYSAIISNHMNLRISSESIDNCDHFVIHRN
jgi:hypothetical protein